MARKTYIADFCGNKKGKQWSSTADDDVMSCGSASRKSPSRIVSPPSSTLLKGEVRQALRCGSVARRCKTGEAGRMRHFASPRRTSRANKPQLNGPDRGAQENVSTRQRNFFFAVQKAAARRGIGFRWQIARLTLSFLFFIFCPSNRGEANQMRQELATKEKRAT